VHGSTLAVALPLDLAAKLLGEAVDQPAAEPESARRGSSPLRAGAREPAFVDDQLLVADRPDAILYIGSAALRRR
jgi:hypothetical protein